MGQYYSVYRGNEIKSITCSKTRQNASLSSESDYLLHYLHTTNYSNMNQLTFQSGTFAGQTIRTTPDGYASIYDIMRVAGVGNEPTHTWNALKGKFCEPHSTSSTSDSRPLTKNFKFSGRGQRDTPVVSGQGLVRLLFLLPGKRARQFVAESAEVLVRHIGGDETLVEEIRRNREIGQTNPQSAQAFMAANIPDNTIAIASVDGGLELEERRARLVKLLNDNERQKEENKAYKLEVLDRYRVYAMEYIDDPRIKEQINNEVTNRK